MFLMFAKDFALLFFLNIIFVVIFSLIMIQDLILTLTFAN